MPTAVAAAPPGIWFVSTSLPQLQSLAATVDQQQGYPRAGIEVGGGIHVKDIGGGPFITQTYAAILPHPNGTQWAYPSDSITSPVATTILGAAVPVALDVTWVGGTVVTTTSLLFSRRTIAIAGIALAAAGLVAGAVMLPSKNVIQTIDAGDSGIEAGSNVVE